MKKRYITLGLALLVLACALSSCGEDMVKIPTLREVWKPVQEFVGPSYSCALYFDNTASMEGFVASGRKGQISNFVSAMSGIYERMEQWRKSSYYCLGSKDGYLNWIALEDRAWDQTKHRQPPDTFYNAFMYEDFYKKLGASFAPGMGPLQLLVGDDTSVDWDELSIFVTDMAEQQMQGGRLANTLANNLLTKPDFSLSIFGMISNYDGIPYTAMDGYVRADGSGNPMDGQHYKGERQFYLILCGPTVDVLRFADQLEATLTNDKKMIPGTDYHRADFLSHDGLGSVDVNDVKTAASLGIQSYSEKLYPMEAKVLKTGIIIPENSNETINFLKVKPEEFIVFENVEDAEGLFGFQYEKSANVKGDDGCIVFYVPLPTLRDGSTATYESEDSSDVTDFRNDTEEEDYLRKVLISPLALDDISIWLGTYGKPAKAGSSEEETETEATAQEEDEMTTVQGIPARLINALDEQKSVEEKAKILQVDPPVHYKTNVERFDGLMRNQDGTISMDQFSVQQQGSLRDNNILDRPAYKVTQKSGVLKIKLYFSDIDRLRAKAQILVIQLPMKVRIPPSDIIPDWVADWNGIGPSKTFGLSSFFAGMTGDNVGDPGQEMLWSNFRLTELINLRIVIKLK